MTLSTSDYIAIITLLLAVLTGSYMFIYKEVTQHAYTRQELIKWLKNDSIYFKYKSLITRFQNNIKSIYGNPISLQSFGVSYILAYIYPTIIIILSYSLLDGPSKFLGIDIINDSNVTYKPFVLPSILVYAVLLFSLLKSSPKIDAFIERIYEKTHFIFPIIFFVIYAPIIYFFLMAWYSVLISVGITYYLYKHDANSKFIYLSILAGISALISYLTFGSYYISSLLFIFTYAAGSAAIILSIFIYIFQTYIDDFSNIFLFSSLFSGLGSIIIIMLPMIIIGTVFGMILSGNPSESLISGLKLSYEALKNSLKYKFSLLTIIIAPIGAVAMYFQDNIRASFLITSLYLLIPALNALFDWVSWMFSRFYIEKSIKERNPVLIFRDIFIDLCIALALLLLMVTALPPIIDLLNFIYEPITNHNIDWRALAKDFESSPYDKGLIVTGMIITTLIPTFIHIYIGLISVFINALYGWKLAEYLSFDEDYKGNIKPIIASAWILFYMIFTICFMYFVYQVAFNLFKVNFSDILYNLVTLVY